MDQICPHCNTVQDRKTFYISMVKNGFTLHPATGLKQTRGTYEKDEFHVFAGVPTRVFPTLKELTEFLCTHWSIGLDDKPAVE